MSKQALRWATSLYLVALGLFFAKLGADRAVSQEASVAALAACAIAAAVCAPTGRGR